ncbi:hypothetical protein B0F90DRAFT_1768347 [Multifurca ochricompacta]|uniref:Uncharacterized protein n=1 Tax=Multifurca ochricompacta TaxID=376703 RepID=A0AAD4LX23_9AGAM|nr:hypothetical protein B0F90DRAFT_1768347 [Multifurca ochricompacta]
MHPRQTHTPSSNSTPPVPTFPLKGFKFSTIGQTPALLERMSDNPRVAFRSPSPGQEQAGTSNGRSRQSLFQALVPGAPQAEHGNDRSTNPTPTQNSNVPVLASVSTPPEAESNVMVPPLYDQSRASTIPDLQYPNSSPDDNNPVSPSSTTQPQPVPMDQDTPHQDTPQPNRLSAPRKSLSVPIPVNGIDIVDGIPDTDSLELSLPSTSPHPTLGTTSSEAEQARRPVEHLIKLASVREERLSKQRGIFDLRSGELSTFSTDALQAAQTVQEKIEDLKQRAEEARIQAEQMHQEANKLHDHAEHLTTLAESLSTDMLSTKNQVVRAAERSEQMTRFMRKTFDWLAALRTRELEKIELAQAELEEQAIAEVIARQQQEFARMQELQRQLEHRKAQEQEMEEAARREEEERETARRKAEKESEVFRKKAYEAQRAAVMADKRRASEAHAQSIQAKRERRLTETPGPSSSSSVRGSNIHPSVSPGIPSELANSSSISTRVPPMQAVDQRVPEVTAASSPTPLSLTKTKSAPAPVGFVPARTKAGRAVNTDSPLSSTTLASELQARNLEISQHPPVDRIAREPVQEQARPQDSKRVEPKPETQQPQQQQQIQIKREPSEEVVPSHAARLHTTSLQPSPQIQNRNEGYYWHQVPARGSSSQNENKDQSAQASSRHESYANSVHAAQPEDHYRRSDLTAPVPIEQGNAVLSQDSRYGRVILSTAYGRQESTSSDRSPPQWIDRNRRSPSPLRKTRSRSRSPSYPRKRARSETPPYEARQSAHHWEPPQPRSRIRPRTDYDRDRGNHYYDYDYERERSGDSPRHYRGPPPRRNLNSYRPSRSPPPSPRQYRYERSPPRHGIRVADSDSREQRMEDHRMNANVRQYSTHEEAEARLVAEKEVYSSRQQRQRRRFTSSSSSRSRTPSPSPSPSALASPNEVEMGLLDRIDMNEDDRGYGRGRPPPNTTRGGANSRRGQRGGQTSGRGRGGASGSTPALLSRMSETRTRAAPPLPLSHRMR